MIRVSCRLVAWCRCWGWGLGLSDRVGLRRLVDEQLTVPTDKGAHGGAKVAALVAGMVAGADSIEDIGLLRHGGMGRLFTGTYAPSTLESFLRCLAFGHVRQLDAVADRLVAELAARAPVLPGAGEIAISTWMTRSGRPTAMPSRAPATATAASRA